MKRAPVPAIDARRKSAAQAFARLHGLTLVKGPTKTLLQTPSGDTRLCVVVSKRTTMKVHTEKSRSYWYVYYPAWDQFLKSGQQSFLLLTCLDRNAAYAICYAKFSTLIKSLPQSKNQARPFWQIPLVETKAYGLCIQPLAPHIPIPLLPYEFSIRYSLPKPAGS